MRADIFLHTAGYAKSRSNAASIISRGVTINGVKITKPAQSIPEAESYDVIISDPDKYVSRGGLKLEAALDFFSVSPKWLHCIDLGASTGGFTDCLLQRGASLVYAIDVGHGQLDERLLADKRVVSMEGVNARGLTKDDVEQCPLAVSDLSFISQSLIYDAVCDILCDGGLFISLIKPQFEAGKENVGKGGIVKDKKIHKKVIEKLFTCAIQKGLSPKGLIPSPIKGSDGNTEYLALFEKGGSIKDPPDINSCVSKAFGE